MKTSFVGLLLGALAVQAGARPSLAVVDSCLRIESASPGVQYVPIAADAFRITEDEEAGKTEITLRHGADTVGIWKVKKPEAFGLLFNGKKTPLARVTRLGKGRAPAAFNPYEAMWGDIRESGKSYICATFNFDGLGQSGSFQNVRGLYLIERRAGAVFYTVGTIEANEDQAKHNTQGSGDWP